ncbi:MAG: DUF58 domain-containing protein [Pseudomonadales bacterium]|nr:DUF58 domain-containing protein [Pseudomonadales bacterium]
MEHAVASEQTSSSPKEAVNRSVLGHRFASWLDRRIPPGAIIKLSQANIFIFPTRAGFVFGALLIVLILGAINYQNALVYGVAFSLGSMFIVTILYTFRNLSGLTLELAESDVGFVGEDLQFNVRVERPKGRGREGIQIGWPEGFKQWVEVFETEAAIVRLYVKADRRGWLKPGRMLVETYYPLGLLRAWTWVDIKARGLAYPKPIFQEISNRQSSRRKDEGELVDPLGSDDFVDIREYKAGDPIKNIIWRSFARTNELVVKRYASYVEPRLWFDFQDIAGDTEERLSRLTGLALKATRSDREFGLRIPGLEIPPGVGQVHLDRVLRELALYGQDRSVDG